MEDKNRNEIITEEGNEACSVCHRTAAEAGKMFHIKGQVFCGDCLQKSLDEMYDAMDKLSQSPFYSPQMPSSAPKQEEPKEKEYEQVCSLCHRPESKAGPMIDFGGLCLCRDCQKKSLDMTASQSSGLESMLKNMFPNIAVMDPSQLGQMFGMPDSKKPKKKKEKSKPNFTLKDIPAPHQMKAMLDEYVVGQEKAKRVMSVAVYNHYKRILDDSKDGVEIEKSNMLMVGPTGSGKTYLVKTLAKLLNVPLAIADATSLTEAGYIGDDIESVLSKLLSAADNDVEKAEYGIVFIDEIDKIAKKKNTNSRDVSGESVQQELLKMLEGSTLEVPVGSGNKNAMVPTVTMDTKNILFICGGAFPDIEGIIKERMQKQSTMGFCGMLTEDVLKDQYVLGNLQMEDLRKFGMIPEFLGRLPVLVTLETLNKDFLVRILKEPKNAILKQYEKLLAMDEVELCYEDAALELIAEKAMEKKTGARALRAILEEYMLDIMYEVPKDDNIGRITITRDYLEHKGGPLIQFRGQIMLEHKGEV